jgi:Zn-dependent protease with chaperone function
MSDQPSGGERNWVSRLRERGADRRAIRADRRARRRARSTGASPDDAARQAESGNMQGGFFTKQSQPKR